MQSKKAGSTVIVRLFPGEDLFPSLEKAFRRHRLKTAAVVSGLGSVQHAKLGALKGKSSYVEKKYPKMLELVALSGLLSLQGKKLFFHLHALLSDKSMKCYAGHLFEAKVAVTAEIVLLSVPGSVKRKKEANGLMGLFVE